MLKSFGADINIEKINNQTSIYIKGKQELRSNNIYVPSDLSSSAFFIIAALINKGSKINLNNININPSRDGILKALKKMRAKIRIKNQRTVSGEIVADLEVEYSNLVGCELNAEMAKLMIDEYPILSIAAAFAKGTSIFRGLKELKVKESNRLELIRLNLVNCGCDCEVINDDLIIKSSLITWQSQPQFTKFNLINSRRLLSLTFNSFNPLKILVPFAKAAAIERIGYSSIINFAISESSSHPTKLLYSTSRSATISLDRVL